MFEAADLRLRLGHACARSDEFVIDGFFCFQDLGQLCLELLIRERPELGEFQIMQRQLVSARVKR